MPRLTAPKDKIEGKPPMSEGLLSVRLDGFKPKKSSKGDSVNLNPVIRVINHAEHNDRFVSENLNTKGQWVWKDFCHCFGVSLQKDASGDYEFPGNFECTAHHDACDGSDPENWEYAGPLLGQLGQLYIVQTDNSKGGIKNSVKYYVCKLPGCTEKHSNDLVG